MNHRSKQIIINAAKAIHVDSLTTEEIATLLPILGDLSMLVDRINARHKAQYDAKLTQWASIIQPLLEQTAGPLQDLLLSDATGLNHAQVHDAMKKLGLPRHSPSADEVKMRQSYLNSRRHAVEAAG